MSNTSSDHLEDEARALADTIDSMPGADDDESDDLSNVLIGEPKKKKPVVKAVLFVCGALVVSMGGMFAYQQFMAPQPKVAMKMPKPQLAAAPMGQAVPPPPPLAAEGGAKPIIDTPKLPEGRLEPVAASSSGLGSPAPSATPLDAPKASTPFDAPKASADPFATAKAPTQEKVPAPVDFAKPSKLSAPSTFSENTLAPNEKFVDVKPVKSAKKAKVSAVAENNDTENAAPKKVAKKLAKKHNSKKHVVTLPNEQQPDNGYNLLF